MADRRTYKNPPIDEALCEFRFAPGQEWDLTIPGRLHGAVKDEYAGKPRNLFQAQLQVAGNAPPAVRPPCGQLVRPWTREGSGRVPGLSGERPMVTDEQVRLLRKKRMQGKTLEAAATAAGMTEKTARKWQAGALPSAMKFSRTWRTRPDPFVDVWAADVEPLLVADHDGELEAKTIFGELCGRYPKTFEAGQLRTLQRRCHRRRRPALSTFHQSRGSRLAALGNRERGSRGEQPSQGPSERNRSGKGAPHKHGGTVNRSSHSHADRRAVSRSLRERRVRARHPNLHEEVRSRDRAGFSA